jgi:hypothetical protein
MPKDLSPEEKLLRLIRGKQEAALPPPQAGVQQPLPEKKDIKQADAENKHKADTKTPAAEHIAGEKKSSRPAKRFFSKSDIAIPPINIYFIILTFLLILSAVFAYVIFTTVSGKDKKELMDLKKMVTTISEDAKRGKKTAIVAKDVNAPKVNGGQQGGSSFEEYQRLVNSKTIFASPGKTTGSAATAGIGVDLREMTKDLRLVGIIPGNEPQAIIEDKKSQQTLFLKQGESISGLELKQISSGRVILGYGEDTITLSM